METRMPKKIPELVELKEVIDSIPEGTMIPYNIIKKIVALNMELVDMGY